jgi:hypothetical protein
MASPQFHLRHARLPCARTSKSQQLNEIGCYLACRDATVSVVTGNANCDTRLVEYRGLCCLTDELTEERSRQGPRMVAALKTSGAKSGG